MNRKKPFIRFIFIGVCLLMTACLFGGLGWAKPVKKVKSQKGVCEVVLEHLKQKRNAYSPQRKALNDKILALEKQQIQLKRISKDKKYSEKEFKKEIEKRKDLEKQIVSSVVSLADIQNKLDMAELQIGRCEKRKYQIELALELESFLAGDAKRQARPARAAGVSMEAAATGAIEEPGEVSKRGEYKISPHDELQINVYGEPDLGKTVRVAADGSISYPLLGRVNVLGLAERELEKRLSKLLSDKGYIINAQVSVYVERFSTISILGEVRNPGSYELKGKPSIVDAIAQAGGFNIDADINNIKVIRVEDGEQKIMHLRLGDVKKGIEGTEVPLKPNDTIFVEKTGKVTVLGEVTRPGTFELKDRLTAIEAIATAGGFTDVAAINGTRIIREEPGSKRKVIRVRVTDVIRRGNKQKDIELLPGDILYVPEGVF